MKDAKEMSWVQTIVRQYQFDPTAELDAAISFTSTAELAAATVNEVVTAAFIATLRLILFYVALPLASCSTLPSVVAQDATVGRGRNFFVVIINSLSSSSSSTSSA